LQFTAAAGLAMLSADGARGRAVVVAGRFTRATRRVQVLGNPVAFPRRLRCCIGFIRNHQGQRLRPNGPPGAQDDLEINQPLLGD
jgi:hypothetical protein